MRNHLNVINTLINANPYTDASMSGKSWTVVFATITEFIERIPDGTDFMDSTIQLNLLKVLRVMWNVLENTKTEDLKPTISLIKAMSELIGLPGAVDGDFYLSISHNTVRSKNAQLEEEINKARKISDNLNTDPDWENSFKVAENHPLFKGMIRFFYEDDIQSSEDFNNRYNVIKGLFDKDGISEQYRTDHILIRALIGSITIWDGNDGLKGRYITEKVEKEGYLKILLGTVGARDLFCGLIHSSQSPLQYFNEVITNAKWRDPNDVWKSRVFRRLVNDGDRTIALFDKMSLFEKKRKKCFHIVTNASTIMVCIPYNERIVLNTERHLIFKELTSKDGFTFRDQSQAKDLSSILEDVWGDNVILLKSLKDSKGSDVVLSLEFDLFKHVSFFITAPDTDISPIDNLLEHKAGRWRIKTQVNYDSFADYHKIKTEVDSIESQIMVL